MSFDRLIERIIELKNPTVVGLDPKLEYVPEYIQRRYLDDDGWTMKAAAKAIFAFNQAIIDEIHDIVPAIKPQAAYYEMYGHYGIKTLERTIKYAHLNGMFVITDGKRNDIGATMEAAYREGKVRAIGISNFYPDRYLDIQHFAEVKPAVNQVETHVFQQQREANEYMKKYGTQIESWGPFAEGKNDYFNNPVLRKIGEKYGKSVAQTALRFLIQSDVVVIPKSTHIERMQENFNVFDFSLTEEEMAQIRALDTGESLFFSHHDPKTVEWFMSII